MVDAAGGGWVAGWQPVRTAWHQQQELSWPMPGGGGACLSFHMLAGVHLGSPYYLLSQGKASRSVMQHAQHSVSIHLILLAARSCMCWLGWCLARLHRPGAMQRAQCSSTHTLHTVCPYLLLRPAAAGCNCCSCCCCIGAGWVGAWLSAPVPEQCKGLSAAACTACSSSPDPKTCLSCMQDKRSLGYIDSIELIGDGFGASSVGSRTLDQCLACSKLSSSGDKTK